MKEFMEVQEGQKFAGGILTREGAAEVNGARLSVASGKTVPLSAKIAKSRRETDKNRSTSHIDKDLYESDRRIYPALPPLEN